MKRRIICKGCGKIALEGWPNTDEIVHSCDCGNNALLVNTGYFRWIALRDGCKKWDEWNPDDAVVTVKKENEKRRGVSMYYELVKRCPNCQAVDVRWNRDNDGWTCDGCGSEFQNGELYSRNRFILSADAIRMRSAMLLAVLEEAAAYSFPVQVVLPDGLGSFYCQVAALEQSLRQIVFAMPVDDLFLTVDFKDVIKLDTGRAIPKIYLSTDGESLRRYISRKEIKVLDSFNFL